MNIIYIECKLLDITKHGFDFMMMTSLPIHLSNHQPQSHKGLERNLSSWCNHQRKTKMTSKEKARANEATMGKDR
jgi:hypothetical protein